MMTTAILAGGLATRLRPATAAIPKSLLIVNGEPFIQHQLRLLRSNGVRHVVLCVGYLGEQIQEAIGDGSKFGLRVEYSFDGSKLLGTAGAIKSALPYLGNAFFVIYGDSYLPCDYAAVERQFIASGTLGLMTVFHNDNKWDTSNVEFIDGRIVEYSKTQKTTNMRFIDYGLGAFHAAAFADVRLEGQTDLAAVYRSLLNRGELTGMEIQERFYEIGSFAGLEETAEYLSTNRGALP